MNEQIEFNGFDAFALLVMGALVLIAAVLVGGAIWAFCRIVRTYQTCTANAITLQKEGIAAARESVELQRESNRIMIELIEALRENRKTARLGNSN